MDPASPAPPTTLSSPIAAGSPQAPWRSVRSYSAEKTCAACGKVFRPWMRTRPDGGISVMQEKHWSRQRFCSISCSKKQQNPMRSMETRKAMRARLKEMRWGPIRRGGNGRLLPLPQLALLHALGPGWEPEWIVTTGLGRESGYPTHYKVDIAHPLERIAIEVDGACHHPMDRRQEDRRKSRFLAENGWLVLRVSNQRALDLYSTYRSIDTLRTSLMGFLSTTAI